MSLLRFERVALDRGGRRLFAGLDLCLEPGDALLVGGPNGSGKSSLIRLAAGLLRPSAGRVIRSRVALADDGLALDREQRLGAALDFWARLDGRSAAAAMAAMGLTRLAEVPVALLSTGQRRRAVLARAIASGAPLWLLDEPGNGLDRDGMALLAEAIAAHRAAGGVVCAASHVALPLPGAQTVTLG